MVNEQQISICCKSATVAFAPATFYVVSIAFDSLLFRKAGIHKMGHVYLGYSVSTPVSFDAESLSNQAIQLVVWLELSRAHTPCHIIALSTDASRLATTI
jgi:hypothetical protein